jgi:hypothetical protein
MYQVMATFLSIPVFYDYYSVPNQTVIPGDGKTEQKVSVTLFKGSRWGCCILIMLSRMSFKGRHITYYSNKAKLLSIEAFTAVMFRVEVFWVVTPCSGIIGYQCFRGPCYLHLHGGLLGCDAV